MNIPNYLILPVLKKTWKRLLFNFSMVHSYMDLKVYNLDCMTVSGFSVRVTGLVFVFKSASLVLKQSLTCIRKAKTNTFDKTLVIFGRFRSCQVVLDSSLTLVSTTH